MMIGGDTKTVQALTYDTSKNTFKAEGSTEDLGANANWLTFDKTKKFILSTSGAKFQNKEKTGGVFSASVSGNTVKKISSSETPEAPVSVEFSPDGKSLLVASFNGGSLNTYSFSADGTISSTPQQTFKFKGSGPVKGRQGQAAAHEVKIDPTGQLLLVPDLGSDNIHSFSFANDGKLTENGAISAPAGCGPRHIEFSPDSKDTVQFYLLCELSSDLIFFELPDAKSTKATSKQVISTLPPGSKGKNTFNAAEIEITPDKKFVYTSNRQKDPAGKESDNIISAFSRDLTTGELKAAGTFPTGGKGPRQFTFSPDEAASLVFVANQDSNIVTAHKRDSNTGALKQVASTKSEAPTIITAQV
ncbi:6-phosphogluconolactonase [Phakopsora pachyrhizi]|nr:6-phosphogluconolactonase [Phakopsora pachyrhizi]